MAERPRLVISTGPPPPPYDGPLCATCKGFGNVAVGEAYEEDGHMIRDCEPCPHCHNGVPFPPATTPRGDAP